MLDEGNVWLRLRPVHRLTVGHGRVRLEKKNQVSKKLTESDLRTLRSLMN